MRFKVWTLIALMCVSSAFAKSAALVGGAADIRVDDAWIKPFPGAPAVAYATLTNTGDNPVSINTVSSPYFDRLAMARTYAPHRSTPVKNIYIKPHTTLAFYPGHVHVLLYLPHGSLDLHKKILLTLGFSDGTIMTMQFEVRQQ